MVANACEGDPTSAKDLTLLEITPHLVLDGIELAAHAVGAVEAVICLHRGNPAGRVWPPPSASATRGRAGSGWSRCRARFVASEESALVNFLTSGDARPR